MRHKLLAGIIPFCSGKRKPSTFTSSGDTTNCNSNISSNNNNMLHSKSTYFYRWSSRYISIAPIACALTLLVGIGLLLNPTTKAQEVYAAEDEEKCKTTADEYGVCAMELGIFMNSTDSAFNELPATELSTDNVVHRDYSFSIRAVDTKDGYDLYAGVVNTGSFGNNLVNADYPTEEYMIKALSGENIAYSSIGNNEWGYALATEDTYTTPAEELTYNSLPTTTITTENNQTILTSGKLIAHGEDTGYDPSQPVGEDKHTDQDYKLYFAAKASPESPSGHYRTQVMLSLVANPKLVASSMQNFAVMGACSSKETNQQFQLVDDRTKSGLGKTTYWVAKLKDGKCWMTQNLDLALTAGAKLSSADTDIIDGSASYTIPTDLASYKDPGLVNYKASAASAAYRDGSGCGNPASTNCSAYFETYTNSDVAGDEKAHYLIGNYYPWTIAMAGKVVEDKGSICPRGWKLPTETEYITMVRDVSNANGTTGTIRTFPYYFVPAGAYKASYANVAWLGNYWTSSVASYNNKAASFLSIEPSKVTIYTTTDVGDGHSVRCVIK